jgi:hypothetical protein
VTQVIRGQAERDESRAGERGSLATAAQQETQRTTPRETQQPQPIAYCSEAQQGSPDTSSNAPMGTAKEASGTPGAMGALGSTKAPAAARDPPLNSPSTTLKKWVGTAISCGGVPAAQRARQKKRAAAESRRSERRAATTCNQQAPCRLGGGHSSSQCRQVLLHSKHPAEARPPGYPPSIGCCMT